MADELTRSLLQSWGLSDDIVEKFKDNDIDFRALKELKEDDVVEFFNTLGQRLRFRSGLKSLFPVMQPVVLGVGPDAPSVEKMSTPKTKSPLSNLQSISDEEVSISLERLIDSVVMEVTAHRSDLQHQQVNESKDDALNIDSLPNEIIVKAFSYLKQNQLGQIAGVCRRWNELAKSPVLWKKVNVTLSPSYFSQTTVAGSFINRLPSCATSIRLQVKKEGNRFGRFDFVELCVKLQEKCPHLEELIFARFEISCSLLGVIDLCMQYLQDIKNLSFFRCKFPGSAARGEYFGISKIQILKLFLCIFDYFDKPPLSKMPCLKELHLFCSTVDDSWFEDGTSFLNQLSVLDLGVTKVSARIFPAIKNNGHNLKELYLCDVNLEDHDLTFNNSMRLYLKSICLSGTRVTCGGLVSLIQSCPSLQNVYVDEDVAESFAAHPIVVANTCKSGIVKTIDLMHTHNYV